MVYIKRDIEKEIKTSLQSNKLTLVFGASGIGKTSMLNFFKKEYDDSFFLISLDNAENLTLIKSDFANVFAIADGASPKYIAIDSIHYLNDQSAFIDFLNKAESKGINFIFTSSYADESVICDSVFYLKPLSFYEFLKFKNIDCSQDLTSSLFDEDKGVYPSLINEALELYMLYGGYPAVWCLKTDADRKKWLQEDGLRFIRSDVYRYGVRNLGKFFELIRLLGERTGLFFTISELASMLDISSPTVESYIRVLQRAMLVTSVRPFAKNYSKEITRTSHFYFTDLGIRNSVLNDFGSVLKRWDRDIYFKNFIYLMLLFKEGEGNIYFWRTQTKVEIDFVVPSLSFALNTSFNGGEVNTNRYKVFAKYYPDMDLKFLSYKKNIKGAVSFLK